MRALIQRVSKANVFIENNLKSSINKGLLVFVGIGNDDNEEDVKMACR